jgi:ubiquinol-cytochrome c reductase cytochrome b subunit
MIQRLSDWLDRRIDHRRLTHDALFEKIPGGARWRYVWGSTLTFAIAVQFITGLALWFGYSPSAQTAWESIYYLEAATPGGWILRGIHHWTAQLMVPLLAFHLLQVVIDGAYRAPREVNFWMGLGLLGLTLALSLTGYLLPWDQKGYWASKVASNLLANVPFIGPALQKLVIGGADFGHYTLTRFFALHAGLLPALLVALIFGHVWLFRHHGITAKTPLRKRDAMFWPDQVLVDGVACLAVMATVLGLVWWWHGAELTSPANPSEAYSAARPDWYFMGLFQLLKFQDFFERLPGGGMLWCAVLIPSAAAAFLFLMPLWSGSRAGHALNLCALGAGLVAFGTLTTIAFWRDAHDDHYRDAVALGERESARVKVLATRNGVPPEGALQLLNTDAFTQAPKLFAAKCASCHSYEGRDGLGATLADVQSAAELKGWGSREWLRDFLDPQKIASEHIWGGTALAHPPPDKKKNPMVDYVLDDIPKYSPEEKAMLERVILAVSAEAELPAQHEADARDAALIEQGRKEFGDAGLNCADCHEFRGEGGGKGCVLTGWGSRAWTAGIVHNPADKNYYGRRNDRMQAFGLKRELNAKQIDMLAQWLRGEVN